MYNNASATRAGAASAGVLNQPRGQFAMKYPNNSPNEPQPLSTNVVGYHPTLSGNKFKLPQLGDAGVG